MSRPRPNPSQAALLDNIERSVRGIRYPLDFADAFCHQVALALTDAGMYCTMEVPMPGMRRVDIVVVSPSGNVAIECDREAPRPGTLRKFAEMDRNVLRLLVLRRRRQTPVVPNCDRVVCVSSSLRPLRWLVDGGAILEETGDDVRKALKHDDSRQWRWDLLTRKPARRAS